MSYRRRMMITNAQSGENYLSFDIIAEAGQTLTFQAQGYFAGGTAAVIDIGNGRQELANDETASRTFEYPGNYQLKIYKYNGTLARWGGTANLVSSNEKWQFMPKLTSLNYSFYGMSNSTLALRTLPPNITNLNNTFYNATNATLPLSAIPDGVTAMNSTFANVKNFSGQIVNLPDTVTSAKSTFNGSAGNGLVRLTKLPPNITDMTAFGVGATFIYADLDELAANAPEGGYQALTTIQLAFSGCSNVTGSRSAFLAVCPNVTNTTNAFLNTNTTE